MMNAEAPNMLDIHVFPIVERIVLIEETAWETLEKQLNVKETAPTIYGYVHKFRVQTEFKDQCVLKRAYESYLANFKKLPQEQEKPPLSLKFLC